MKRRLSATGKLLRQPNSPRRPQPSPGRGEPGQGSAAGGSRGRGGAMAEPAPVLLLRSRFSP